MLCLLTLVFNSLKSTTGLLSLVIFLVISITGEVWLVVFLLRIFKEHNLFMCLSMMGLSSSLMRKGLTKNGESSITSMSILIFGHSPISSIKLKAYLCSKIICISFPFSLSLRRDWLRSVYFLRISSSNMFLLGSCLSSQGYASSADGCSFFCFSCFTCLPCWSPCCGLGLSACLTVILLNCGSCLDRLYWRVACLIL